MYNSNIKNDIIINIKNDIDLFFINSNIIKTNRKGFKL